MDLDNTRTARNVDASLWVTESRAEDAHRAYSGGDHLKEPTISDL